MRAEPLSSAAMPVMRPLLSPFVLAVLMTVAVQAQFKLPNIKDRPTLRTAEATVLPGKDRRLCVTLPDGTRRNVGADTYQYFSNAITAEVFAKAATSRNWGGACGRTDDSMSCPSLAGARFIHSVFELEPEDAYHRHACWTFANGGEKPMTARLVVHFALREIENGFVLLLRKPGSKEPVFTSVESPCTCSSDEKNVIAYFGLELRPSNRFFAKRGDVIEIDAISKTNELGIPDGCHELTRGKYHVKIQRIYPFDQPADYKTILAGQIVQEPVTDVSSVFDRH